MSKIRFEHFLFFEVFRVKTAHDQIPSLLRPRNGRVTEVGRLWISAAQEDAFFKSTPDMVLRTGIREAYPYDTIGKKAPPKFLWEPRRVQDGHE